MARYSYDPEADVLIIKLKDGAPDHGEEVALGIIARFDKYGNLLEIEILDASEIAIDILKKLTEYSKALTSQRLRPA